MAEGVSGMKMAVVVGVTALVFLGAGLAAGRLTASTSPASAGSVTSTTTPQALFDGQARDWLQAHGTDLTLISAWAKDLGDAAKARDPRLTNLSIEELLLQVGKADGDLPSNAFGVALHKIFVKYVAALDEIHSGLVHADQQQFSAGASELATAVAKFGTLTASLRTGR